MNEKGRMRVTVKRRTRLSRDVVLLELKSGDTSLPAFAAGAHIDVEVGGFTRQYSLCGDPADNDAYRIAVLREPASRGGSVAMHALREGDTVIIGAPRNLFELVPQTRAILIGGGIGITPLLAMGHALFASGVPFTVHYAENESGEMPFRDTFGSEPFVGRTTVHRTSRKAGRPFAATEAIGRYEEGAQLYMCGPEGFMGAVRTEAAELGWPPAAIHHEHFKAQIEISGDGFVVVAARSGVEVVVDPEQSIAGALSAAGVDVSLSCEQGVCGTCLTPILEGEADHRDLYLTEAEQADQKEMAICCSRARGGRIVLDI